MQSHNLNYLRSGLWNGSPASAFRECQRICIQVSSHWPVVLFETNSIHYRASKLFCSFAANVTGVKFYPGLCWLHFVMWVGFERQQSSPFNILAREGVHAIVHSCSDLGVVYCSYIIPMLVRRCGSSWS